MRLAVVRESHHVRWIMLSQRFVPLRLIASSGQQATIREGMRAQHGPAVGEGSIYASEMQWC